MNRSNKLSYLLALLLALGSAVSFTSSTGFEICPDNASCISDSPDFGWLENDEDANDLDSLSCESNDPEYSLRNTQPLPPLFSQLAPPLHWHSQIRAPPLSF